VIILDTDALAHLQKRDPVGDRIEASLHGCDDRDVRITSITTYEMLGGAVALIDRRNRERRDLVPAFYLPRWVLDRRSATPTDALASEHRATSRGNPRERIGLISFLDAAQMVLGIDSCLAGGGAGLAIFAMLSKISNRIESSARMIESQPP
jgi:predicted nucleic acid-binding protein